MDSIYSKLKKTNRYNGSTGEEEINFLYFYSSIPTRIQALLADELIKSIMDMKVEKKKKVYLLMNDIPIISYSDALISKIKALVREGMISEIWLKNLIKTLVFEGVDKKAVQLGLLLAGEYIQKKYIQDVVETFCKDGDYIFYIKDMLYNMKKYNSFLYNLAQKSSGSVKIFCILNMEILDDKIKRYIIEESYKNEIEEELLIDYIILNVDIGEYIKSNQLTSEKVNNLGYIIQSYISYKELESLDIKEELVNNYIPLAIEKGNDIYCLYSMFLIKSEIEKDDKFLLNKKKIINDIKNVINQEKWKQTFIKAIYDNSVQADLIIELACYYSYKLSFDELEKFLVKEYKNINIYEYLAENGDISDREKIFNFFESKFDLDLIMDGPENILIEDVDSNYIEDILFLFVVRGLRKLSEKGKQIALRALSARLNDTRWQAINMLEKYESFTDEEIKLIELAEENEPNEDIRNRIKQINRFGVIRKDFIKIEDIRITPYIDDIYLSSIEIGGIKERNQYYLQNELEQSTLYYITLYKENEYDIQDVKVVGPGGYILGYISKEEKNIFKNLMKGGKYLYCRLDEYDLTKSFVKVKVYLSLKDIVDYCQETIQLMAYPEGKNS